MTDTSVSQEERDMSVELSSAMEFPFTPHHSPEKAHDPKEFSSSLDLTMLSEKLTPELELPATAEAQKPRLRHSTRIKEHQAFTPQRRKRSTSRQDSAVKRRKISSSTRKRRANKGLSPAAKRARNQRSRSRSQQ